MTTDKVCLYVDSSGDTSHTTDVPEMKPVFKIRHMTQMDPEVFDPVTRPDHDRTSKLHLTAAYEATQISDDKTLAIYEVTSNRQK